MCARRNLVAVPSGPSTLWLGCEAEPGGHQEAPDTSRRNLSTSSSILLVADVIKSAVLGSKPPHFRVLELSSSGLKTRNLNMIPMNS